jgi:hypothetical protein
LIFAKLDITDYLFRRTNPSVLVSIQTRHAACFASTFADRRRVLSTVDETRADQRTRRVSDDPLRGLPLAIQ